VSLRKIYNSLKDGMSSPADWFEVVTPEEKDPAASLKDKIKSKSQTPDGIKPEVGA
jgi:hypothetical protein